MSIKISSPDIVATVGDEDLLNGSVEFYEPDSFVRKRAFLDRSLTQVAPWLLGLDENGFPVLDLWVNDATLYRAIFRGSDGALVYDDLLSNLLDKIDQTGGGGGGSGGVPEAPNDDTMYGRLNESWIPAVSAGMLGANGGVATLDDSGKLLTTQLPALAINDVFVVATQAAMLALTAQNGDIAVRSDVSQTFILAASPATTLANWVVLPIPPNTVLSVAGRTGVIVLTTADIASGTFSPARLGGGTLTNATFLAGDGTFKALTNAVVAKEIPTAVAASATLAAANVGQYLRSTSATPVNITVPTNATVAFAVGVEIPIYQLGAGQFTLVAAGGVTLHPPFGGSLVSAGAGAKVVLKKAAADEWDISGQTVSA